jgi:hypothetical protein
MTHPAISAEALAAGLAARLLHDLSSPASGISSGLDLLNDPAQADFAADALAMITGSFGDLRAMLEFQRVAYGPPGAPLSGAEAGRLAQAPFAGRRGRLTWAAAETDFEGLAGPVALILCELGSAGLGMGGDARLTATRQPAGVVIALTARGARAELPQDIRLGLQGEPKPPGLPGRWAPAAYLHALVTREGGEVDWTLDADGFSLKARLPRSV